MNKIERLIERLELYGFYATNDTEAGSVAQSLRLLNDVANAAEAYEKHRDSLRLDLLFDALAAWKEHSE